MAEPSQQLTALESVWAYRIRQRIVLERIILLAGNQRERQRAQQFLEAMQQANPELFEDIDQHAPELLEEVDFHPPELFDDSEYAKAPGRKRALKLPRDIRWEEKIVRRATREYGDLFHPCEKLFNNAMQGLQYLDRLHPVLFASARSRAIEKRDQLLSREIFCRCGCTSEEDRLPADTFEVAGRGRFRAVSQRISQARQKPAGKSNGDRTDWPFFLDRISEVAPEMLETGSR